MWASVNPYESLISNYEQFGVGGMYLPVERQQSPASLRQYVMLRKLGNYVQKNEIRTLNNSIHKNNLKMD